jgi:branched-chain amino acid transport system substrate-binding protein
MDKKSKMLLSGVVFLSFALFVSPHICCAKDVSQGIDAKDKVIKVGAYVPESGPVPFYMRICFGAMTRFYWQNDQGGINGWKIDFVTRDDGYQASRTVAVTKQLVERDKVFALASNIGTPNSIAVLPYIKEAGIPTVGPVGASPKFTNPVIPNVFTLLPDYTWEAERAAEYLVEKLGTKKIGVLYENDDLGIPGFKGVKAYLKTKNLEVVGGLPFDVTEIDFSSYAFKMKEAGAEAVCLWGSNKNVTSFAREGAKIGYKPVIFAYAFVSDPTTFQLAGDILNDRFYVASWMMPLSSTDRNMQVFKEALKKYFPREDVGFFPMNGYSHASVLIRGIEKVMEKKKKLSWENLIEGLNSIKNEKIGLVGSVTYSPSDHAGVKKTAILKAVKGEMVQVTEFEANPAIIPTD